MWIPPGCRTDLTHDADVTRFTTRPVMTERRVVEFSDGDFVDLASGEIMEIEAERGATASEGQAPDEVYGTQPATGDVTRVTADMPGSDTGMKAAASTGAAVAHAQCVGDAAPTIPVEEPVANESTSTDNVAQPLPESKLATDDNLEIPSFLDRKSADRYVNVASPRETQSVAGEGST